MDRLLLWEAAPVNPPSAIFAEVRPLLLQQRSTD
jgi:hypothetical protein